MVIRRFFAFVISLFLFFSVVSYAALPQSVNDYAVTIKNVAKNSVGVVADFAFRKKSANDGVYNKPALTVSHGKIANQWPKRFMRFGVGAVGYAVVSELLEGVDWVMDPVNNEIYKIENGYLWTSGRYPTQCKDMLSADAVQGCIIQQYKKTNAGDYQVYPNMTPEQIIKAGSGDLFSLYKPGTANVYFSVRVSLGETKRLATETDIENDAIKHMTAEALEPHLYPQIGETNADIEWVNDAANSSELDPNSVPNPDPDPDGDTGGSPEPDPDPDGDTGGSPKAPPEGEPFELPEFCAWAAPVCDFFEWVQAPVPPDDEEEKDVPFATTGDVGLDDVDRFEKRIDFTGQCPVNDFSFTMMGVTYAKPIPYHHLCGFLEQIAPWLLAMCYLGVAYFVVENI